MDPSAHGIVTRSRAEKQTTAVDLSIAAAKEAVAASGVDPAEIDLDRRHDQQPAPVPRGGHRCGRHRATPAAAYDSNAACAGYCYGIAQADALIRTGAARYAVVIEAEKLSDIVDPTDRSISFLLGDGAGAAVIGPSTTPGISVSQWGSDGSKAGSCGH